MGLVRTISACAQRNRGRGDRLPVNEAHIVNVRAVQLPTRN